MTSLVGRSEEIANTVRSVRDHRLVTLFGPGGAGKTRVAQHAAAGLDAGAADGVWYVELMPISDPQGVAGAFVAALPPTEVHGSDARAQLLDRIGDGEHLLIVDNCEHLVDAVAELVKDLLTACPNARVLATSRELLNVPGEVPVPVGPLSSPPLTEDTPVDLRAFDATRLFLERATVELEWRHDEIMAIAQICSRLDGLPLAIELAAARMRLLSVQQIAEGLDDRFSLLSSVARTASVPQRTLEASIGWSIDLLDEDEWQMLARLAMFPGMFDVDGARAVGGLGNRTVDILGSLVDKSLVTVVASVPAHRYRLLESIRLYGINLLEQREEIAAARDAHVEYALVRAAEIGLALMTSMGRRSVARARGFVDDARAADAWARARGTPAAVVDLHWPLMAFHQVAETTAEVIASLEAVVESPQLDVDHQARAYAMLVGLPGQSGSEGDVVLAHSRAPRAIQLARRNGDPFVQFVALSGASFAAAWSCSDGTAHAREAIELAESLGVPWLQHVGATYLSLALLYAGHGPETLAYSLATAEGLEQDEVGGSFEAIARTVATSSRMLLGPISALEEELERVRRVTSVKGASRHVIVNTFLLPYSLIMMGEMDKAIAHAERSLVAAPTEGTLARAAALLGSAIVHEAAGDMDRALEHAQAAMGAFDGRWSGMWLWMSKAMLALVQVQTGDIENAAAVVTELREQVPDDGFFIVHSTLGIAECLVAQHTSEDAAVGMWLDHAHRELSAGMLTWNVRTLGYVAGALVDAGRSADAVTLLGACEAQATRLETRYTGGWQAPRVDAERRARAELDEELADERYATGTGMGVDEVVGLARRRRGPQRRAVTGWASLTPTEQVVVDKVTGGMTNAQVAEAMFVTINTVKTHLSNTYRKLGVRSRTALAAKVMEQADRIGGQAAVDGRS